MPASAAVGNEGRGQRSREMGQVEGSRWRVKAELS